MIEAQLRSQLQPLFNNLGTILHHYSISSFTLTLFAFVTGLLAALLIGNNYLVPALCCLWLSGLCDVLDGTVARLSHTASALGAYSDLLSDRLVEAAIITGLAYAYPGHAFSCVLFLSSVLFHFSTFVVAGALFPNYSKKSMHHEYSIIERAEAFLVLSLVILWPQYTTRILILFALAIFSDGVLRFLRIWRYAQA